MSEKATEVYWQNGFKLIKDRGLYLLHSEKLTDCKFLVGTAAKQRILTGHKLILAMASNVFERMFFGSLPEESDRILIPDVQPDVFQAMMEYIYSDIIKIGSFDKACELYYVAQKYMLPFLVEQCTTFLMDNVNGKNACRAYEFAKLFDLPRLMEKSMSIITANTRVVLRDPSFVDIEMSTLMAILDQNKLNISSELELFNALAKYASELEIKIESEHLRMQHLTASKNDSKQQLGSIKTDPSDDGVIKIESGASNILQNEQEISLVVDDVVVARSDTSGIYAEKDRALKTTSSESNVTTSVTCCSKKIEEGLIRKAVRKIRFLTLTPKQFAEGPAHSKLLEQREAFEILIKISSPTIKDFPMPKGFCLSNMSRSSNVSN